MKLLNKIVLLVFSFSTVVSYSQTKNTIKMDKEYNNFAYINAIDVYKKVIQNGVESDELYQKIGNSYYFNAELIKANEWYEKLFIVEKTDIGAEYYFRYSQTLKAIGNYTKANEYLTKFSEMNKMEIRSNLYKKNKNYLDEISEFSNRQKLQEFDINSAYSDYGASFYKDQFVFTSTRDTGSVANIKHSWTNQAFSNLFIAKISPEGKVETTEKLNKKINLLFNESSAIFTKDGNTIYFTRNNSVKKKLKKDKEGVSLLKLFKATFKNGDWEQVEELPFNSDDYSCAHPALSPDEKTLYFASNMPGSIGQSDIFKVAINSDGTYGKPENLGKEINSEGRETYPFISANNELYFASDGHPGLGGLDIFGAKIYNDNTFSKIYNVGAPVNSQFDDFAYIVDSSTSVGFFSSNRSGGKGNDDIYKFIEEIPLPFHSKHIIEGIVFDNATSTVLPNSTIVLLDENMNPIKEVKSDDKGNYVFTDLEYNKKYYVRVSNSEYESTEVSTRTNDKSGKNKVDVRLNKVINKITVGNDLAKVFDIKSIYFDSGKSDIRPDAAIELQKILEVLKANPTIKIDIRSHTDSRQSAEKNLILSNKRAKSTIDWMIKKGISADRLTGKGYGESKLINNCSDGVPCSEEQHQENRRTEFIIVKI